VAAVNLPTAIERRCRCPLDHRSTVCPGVVRKELWNDMTESDRDAFYRNTPQRLPVGRLGEADDLADAYVYLVRDRYSTCQVIVVDGGAVLV
jgi:NAD(P)-dependent dehydrogenase (short-subunit alcohol dehydrogenase family)